MSDSQRKTHPAIAQGLHIRPPVLADCNQLGELHVSAWRTAYRDIMPERYLASLRAADRADQWRQILSQQDDLWRRVAVVDSRVVGFCVVGANRTAGVRASELWALNVDPSVFGTGVGQSLLAHAMAELRARPQDCATLWCVKDNHRALRFYQRNNWHPDGTERVEYFDDVAVTELCLLTELRVQNH